MYIDLYVFLYYSLINKRTIRAANFGVLCALTSQYNCLVTTRAQVLQDPSTTGFIYYIFFVFCPLIACTFCR